MLHEAHNCLAFPKISHQQDQAKKLSSNGYRNING